MHCRKKHHTKKIILEASTNKPKLYHQSKSKQWINSAFTSYTFFFKCQMPFACTLEQNEGGVFRKQVVLHSPGIGAPPLPMRGIHLGRGLYAESQNSSAFGAKPPLGTYHQTNIGKNNNDNLAQISKFRWKYPLFSLEVFPQGDFSDRKTSR